MRTDLVTDALRMAIAHRNPPPGVIFHSDRGCQYTSEELRIFCRANGVRPSVGRTGICFDNAVAESFFATHKKELVHTRPWPTIDKLRTAVFEYIESYYNRCRRHSTIGYDTPIEYEKKHALTRLQAALPSVYKLGNTPRLDSEDRDSGDRRVGHRPADRQSPCSPWPDAGGAGRSGRYQPVDDEEDRVGRPPGHQVLAARPLRPGPASQGPPRADRCAAALDAGRPSRPSKRGPRTGRVDGPGCGLR